MTRILEKFSVYPPRLFFCSDNEHSMHFILSLKYLSRAQQEELVELLHHCGAEVSFSLEDVTHHSAVIVDHDEIVKVKIPAFTLKYIKECLSELKVQDISKYRQDATSHIASNVDCMEVVYFRTRSWDSVLTEAEKQWFHVNVDSRRPVEPFEPQAASTCLDILGLVNRRLGLCNQKDDLKPEEEEPKTIIGNRLLSSDEDSDLEQNDNRVSVNKTCEKVNNTNVEIEKSPKAVKESTNSLSKDPVPKRKNGTDSFREENSVHSGKKQKINSSRSREVDTTSSTSAPSTSKWSFPDEFQQGSSDEEDLQPKATEKEEKKSFFDFAAADEDLFKPSKDKKRSRMLYSFDEQIKILKYIVDHCEYSRIKGRELWMIMERRKICPNRTWQSMKEHFVKKIAFNLEAFDFLTESNKRKLKEVLF